MSLNVEREISKVRAEVSAGDYSLAGERCAAILNYTEHEFVRFILGFSLAQQGKHDAALLNLQRARELGLLDWSLELSIARSLEALQKPEEALMHAQASLALSPENSEVTAYIINLMGKTKQFENARVFYRELSDTSRTHEVWSAFSNLRLEQGDQEIDVLLQRKEFESAKNLCSRLLDRQGQAHYLHRLQHIEAHERWAAYIQKRRADDPSRVKPLLTVLLVTYNHEKFIGQAIQSVIDQDTEYDIRIDIVEDCSTDRTRNVIMEYKAKHPNMIRTYFNPTNIGTLNPPQQKVTYAGLKRMDGDYMCILEGDDYWSDKNKVQKQISFLEANPGFAATAHNTIKIYEDEALQPHRFIYQENCKQTHWVQDFIAMTSFFHTSSIIYRNLLCDNMPKQFASRWSCDIFNTIAHVEKGKLNYMDLDMSVYRAHSGGSYSNMPAKDGRIFNIEGLRKYNRWMGYRYSCEFNATISRLCRALIEDSDQDLIEKITPFERRYYLSVAWLHDVGIYLSRKIPFLVPAALLYGEPTSKNFPKAYVAGIRY